MVATCQDSRIFGYKFSVESTVGQSFEYGMDRKRVTLQFLLVLVLLPIVIFMLRPAKHELVPGLRIALLVVFILSALITLFVFLGAWLSKDVKLVINEKGVRFGKASIPWRYISAVSVVRIGNSYGLAFWPRDAEQLLAKLQPPAREKLERRLQKRGVLLEVPDICISGGARRAMSHIDLFCIEQIRAHEPGPQVPPPVFEI